MEYTHKPYGPYEKFIKRPLDLVLSLGAIVVLSPVMGITAILVRKKLGSPILYRTIRAGRIDSKTGIEQPFELIKFRTMTNETDENGELLSDTDRLTHFGRILRAMSLDELPELINIIRGDMSIIGPRPLPTIYLPYYSEEEHHRHDVKPGLSGLAQVNGRNSVSWERKFEYDLTYVKKITFKEDMRIVLDTIKKVITHEGIGQGEEAPESLHILRKNRAN